MKLKKIKRQFCNYRKSLKRLNFESMIRPLFRVTLILSVYWATCLLLPFEVSGTSPVILSNQSETASIRDRTELFFDGTATLTFEQVQSSAKFKLDTNWILKKADDGVLWLKFQSLNQQRRPKLLKVRAKSAILYSQQRHGGFKSDTLLFHSRWVDREHVSTNPFDQFFPLDLVQGSLQTHFLRVEPTFARSRTFNPIVEIVDRNQLVETEFKRKNQFYFLIGIMLLAFSFALARLLIDRDLSAVYFFMSICWVIVFLMSEYGVYFPALYHFFPMLAAWAPITFPVSVLIWLSLYTQDLLALKQEQVRAHKVLRLMLLTLGGIVTGGMFLLETSIPLRLFISLLSLAILILLTTVAWKAYKRGKRFVRFILLSYGLLLVMALLVIFMYLGLFESSIDFYALGFVSIVVFYMIGIADNIAVERAEKQKILTEQNETLEREVKLQTAKIAKQNDLLAETNEEITAEKQKLEEINAKLISTQDKLVTQQKLASLGQLTAGIAHEIKNPLNFINNFAQVSSEISQEALHDIMDDQKLSPVEKLEEIGELLTLIDQNNQKIAEHGKRADQIVKGMLMHSRNRTDDFEETVLNELIEQTIELAYHGFRATNPGFQCQFNTSEIKSEITAKIHPQDLGRVLLNIINNALFALQAKQKTEKNGFVPEIEIKLQQTEKFVEIEIVDNGPGIPESIRDQIFQPFFTTKPTGTGNTGLGLSLSYDIVVEQHKGDLRVSSEKGKYTRFTIEIPA